MWYGKTWYRSWTAILPTWVLSVTTVQGAELSVSDVIMSPGMTANVVVSGNIAGESTYGVCVQLEIVPRAGATGTVEFTSAASADVVQLGDPWPGAGVFSAYDTDATESLILNGHLDDDGSFVAEPVIFSGALASFPVVASADAEGVWDVLLSTSAGDSNWEGLTTSLTAGTIVADPEYYPAIPAVSEWGMVAMTLLVLTAGTLVFVRKRQAART